MDIDERISTTKDRITSHVLEGLEIMIQKNNDRGDAWRASGLLGQFIEIHSMYHRLRALIYEKPMRAFTKNWDEQVKNALLDMRNFTILADLCVDEKNFDGSNYILEKLPTLDELKEQLKGKHGIPDL